MCFSHRSGDRAEWSRPKTFPASNVSGGQQSVINCRTLLVLLVRGVIVETDREQLFRFLFAYLTGVLWFGSMFAVLWVPKLPKSWPWPSNVAIPFSFWLHVPGGCVKEWDFTSDKSKLASLQLLNEIILKPKEKAAAFIARLELCYLINQIITKVQTEPLPPPLLLPGLRKTRNKLLPKR